MRFFVVIFCMLIATAAFAQETTGSSAPLKMAKGKIIFKTDSLKQLLTGINWGVKQNKANKMLLRKMTSAVPQSAQPCGGYLCGFICPQPSKPTWTGHVDSNWFNAANWCAGAVPAPNADVTISTTSLYFPKLITDTVRVHNITIEEDAEMKLADIGVIQISGSVNSAGIFRAGGGTLVYNGTTLQHIAPNTFANNAVKNLVVTNAAGVIVDGILSVSGSVQTQGSLLVPALNILQ